jgi:tetratricopeptide (TPR) repeat protein
MPSLLPLCLRLIMMLLLVAFNGATWAGDLPVEAPSKDRLVAVMAGEFALQSGRLQDAAQYYLDAAKASEDPVLAERAARIALLADDDALTADALQVWRAYTAEVTLDQRMFAASLALRAGQRRQAVREIDALMDAPDGWRLVLAALAGATGKQPALVGRMLKNVINHGPQPDGLQGWLAMGGLAQRLGQEKLVERVVQQVVQRFPDEPRVALLRAQLLRETGQREAAKAALLALTTTSQMPMPLRWALASEYEALGEYSKAAVILAEGEQDDAVYLQRAILLERAADNAGMTALYSELNAGGTDPNPMRRLLLGQLAEQLEQYDDALRWYGNVPQGRAQDIARLRAAHVLHAKGEPSAAYAALQALQSDARLDENMRRDSYLLEAELQHKDKNIQGEQAVYARGLAAFPDNQDILYARALMWERQDEIARAEADFRRILVIFPDHVITLNALGYTLADRTTRYREALELIDRARVAEPDNAAIIDSYGWVLFRLGKPREALEHLRHAYALQKDPDIASHLGQVLWVLGKKSEARKYFDEAKALEPENRSLQRALKETGA